MERESRVDSSGDRREHGEQETELKLAVEERSRERAHSTEHSEEDEPITEINVTPLVDVALVLVIIFMAVSPFMLQASLTVSESKAGAATGKHSLEDNVQISLTAEGKLMVNSEVIAPSDLYDMLKEKFEK